MANSPDKDMLVRIWVEYKYTRSHLKDNHNNFTKTLMHSIALHTIMLYTGLLLRIDNGNLEHMCT